MKSLVSVELDACLWAKNSARLLPITLKRFHDVVPRSVVHRKILVDDHSEDETASIGESFDWEVHENPGRGITSAANEALRQVSTTFFISLEHDVFLARNWWPRIFSKIADAEDVAVAQGLRLPSDHTLRAIEGDAIHRTIDNNVFRTDLIRKIGGFPYKCRVCTDAWLHRNVEAAGFRWIVDPTVISTHIRSGVLQEAAHKAKQISMCTCGVWRYDPRLMLRLTLLSPLSGLRIARRYRTPKAILAYPYLRFQVFKVWMANSALRGS